MTALVVVFLKISFKKSEKWTKWLIGVLAYARAKKAKQNNISILASLSQYPGLNHK